MLKIQPFLSDKESEIEVMRALHFNIFWFVT